MTGATTRFLGGNPGVGLRFVNDNWLALIAALRRRELDLVVAAPLAPEESGGLSINLLSPHQGRFLVRRGHPLLAKQGLSLQDVASCPIVCGRRLPAAFVDALQSARRPGTASRLVPDVACESHDLMAHIAATTDHVLLSGLAACGREIDSGALAALPLVDPRLRVTFAIIPLRARTLRPIADDFVRAVIAADRGGARALAGAEDRWPATTRRDGGAEAPRESGHGRRPLTRAARRDWRR